METFNVITKYGHTLTFDANGLDLYRSCSWRVIKSKTKCGRVYKYLESCSGRRLFHRVITSALNGMVVDHIDGNGLNNAKSNLRVCSHAQNMRNRQPNVGKDLPKGVGRRKYSFYAEIKAGGIRKRKSGFRTALDAARQYAEWSRELHGEFSRTSDISQLSDCGTHDLWPELQRRATKAKAEAA